jgi:hypothetical protein
LAEFEKVLNFDVPDGDGPSWEARITLTQDELKYLQAVCQFAGDNAPDYVTKGNGGAYAEWFGRMRKNLAHRSLRTFEEFKATKGAGQ